jgi:aromatic-L-amino-acid/L-tryptophan decarboxylase
MLLRESPQGHRGLFEDDRSNDDLLDHRARGPKTSGVASQPESLGAVTTVPQLTQGRSPEGRPHRSFALLAWAGMEITDSEAIQQAPRGARAGAWSRRLARLGGPGANAGDSYDVGVSAEERDAVDAPMFSLSREEMRRLGYAVIDAIVEELESLPKRPLGERSTAHQVATVLDEPLPLTGLPVEEVIEDALSRVLPHRALVNHPRYLAYVPPPGNYVGLMGDVLAQGLAVFAGTWQSAAGPAAVELAVLRWFAEIFGWPPDAGGLFTDGGSSANLICLTAARTRVPDTSNAVVYASGQTHSAIARALMVLGFRADQLVEVPADDAYELDVDALQAAVSDDRARGRKPFCIVANAGTTNTGAFDPLRSIAELAKREGMWLHVDGAFGAAAILSTRKNELLGGIEDADSIAFDAHKWFFQPHEAGCALVREPGLLEDTFSVHPEYLIDAAARQDEVNFSDRGIQLTRSFRALKVWLSFKSYGLDYFRRAVERGIALAELAEEGLRKAGDWVIVAPTQISLVTFRYHREGADEAELEMMNRRLADIMLEDEIVTLSSTLLEGRTSLRLCTVNPRTTTADLELVLERLEEKKGLLEKGA